MTRDCRDYISELKRLHLRVNLFYLQVYNLLIYSEGALHYQNGKS